jgi:hypothetical protein
LKFVLLLSNPLAKGLLLECPVIITVDILSGCPSIV